MSGWKSAYEANSELKEYGDNGLALFALALKFGVEDLQNVAADAITDGFDDKKLDLVYINTEDEYAVICQCYYSEKERQTAPANKASDLNTGIAWLLQRNIDEVPERIKSAAVNLRKALEEKKIKTIYFWYTHNLPESQNVESELVSVQQTAVTALSSQYPESNVQVIATEVGTNNLTDWYEECQTPILVSDSIKFDSKIGYEVKGPHWNAFNTAISLQDLYRLYKKHKTKIFSANIRDYLGSRSSNSNINNGIKNTAENEPENFWAYNNGLTILTHGYSKAEDGALVAEGLSIVNGAQTTGAIGSARKLPSKDALVQARFIAINNGDADLIQRIIQFNNSQNKVEAADFRSTDKIQKRLKEEMKEIPEAEYEGGRRGGVGDAIKRRPNLLSSYAVGQALAAFHGDPIVAYNQKSGIWINDRSYSKYFNESTKAAHIVCVYSLVKAIEEKKKSLSQKTNLTSVEQDILNFFRQRGSIYLYVSAISACAEVFLNRPVPNNFRISFGNISPNNAKKIWSEVIESTLPLCIHLNNALIGGLKNIKEIEKAIVSFRAVVSVVNQSNSEIYQNFKNSVKAP
ncbi:AIPR family protein [Shewanella algae]|uniref:AIPR family protein n=1 Tax=Shewanella algae TaxID=38313 RepID=UPI0012DD69C4|nr:AIPR family protein [Shewanella algae]MBO2668107.1 AIPR family protein [Shewanella algae]QGS58635.1 hypothetical protein GMX02_03385 [Shewanella algae]